MAGKVILSATMPPKIIEDNVTFEDFIKRYEGQRVEWHAGKVVEKVSNNTQHNFIVFFLAQVLSFYLSYEKLGKIITDGVSMYINDDVPARQPDIMVLLNNKLSQIKATQVEGAADIVVEVVSPRSSAIDKGVKFHEYEAAGVQEYWLIDPIRKQVDVYELNDEGLYQRISSESHLQSHVLADFSLDISILWQDDLPAGPALGELVNTMLDV